MLLQRQRLYKCRLSGSIKCNNRSIKSAIAKGESIQLIGFDTFSISESLARTGRNPHTDKEIQIAAKKVAKFKPGKDLDYAINRKYRRNGVWFLISFKSKIVRVFKLRLKYPPNLLTSTI